MRVDTYRRQATTLPCRPADKQAMKLRPFGREFPTASFEWKRALPSSPRVWQQGASVSQSILIANHSSFADERPVSEREEANDSSYLFLVKICTHTHTFPADYVSAMIQSRGGRMETSGIAYSGHG